MRHIDLRRGFFKSWALAAAVTCGLAACGGGGDASMTTGGAASPLAASSTVASTPATSGFAVASAAQNASTSPLARAQPLAAGPLAAPFVPPVLGTPAVQFYTSWTSAMQDATAPWPGAVDPAPTFTNQTVRQIVRLSLGGDTIRVKLSNRFGKSPATFAGVRVARSLNGGSEIDIFRDRPVTFAGQTSVTLPAGAEMTSDVVPLAVASRSLLAVSMYFASTTAMPTVHSDARRSTYVVTGNQVSASTFVALAPALRESYYGLTAVEASSALAAKVVVAFGDSLTEGVGTPTGSNLSYANQLDDRLKAEGQRRTSVVNGGISGNRALNEYAGPSGVGRFNRDVLDVTGLTHVILLLGINDIGFSVAFPQMENVSAQQLIDAVMNGINAASARGVKVTIGTLTPFRGSGYYSVESEAKRNAVNAWIRSQSFAAVADFDLAVRDPADPAALNPAYDSGDHLHLNSLGYGAMASVVDLSKL